jgi:CRISPR-associated protein Csd1
MKLAKQHLTKLMGEKTGLAVNIDKEIQSILADVQSFPITLRLEEQGMFALGYYHQKNDRRADVTITN